MNKIKALERQLEKLIKIKRHKYHPLIHKIHKEHKISRKTLLYIKEYGPHSNISKTIVRESIKILLFASILSSLGGFALEGLKSSFLTLLPLIILLPALNSMIGGYGIVLASKFSAMLHEGKIKQKWPINKELKILICQIFVVACFAAITGLAGALLFSYYLGYILTSAHILKLLVTVIISVISIVIILALIVVIVGWYTYKRNLDPNNFLIPITTSLADFINMIVLALLLLLLF